MVLKLSLLHLVQEELFPDLPLYKKIQVLLQFS